MLAVWSRKLNLQPSAIEANKRLEIIMMLDQTRVSNFAWYVSSMIASAPAGLGTSLLLRINF
jgi:hypothetical protein